MSISTWTTLAAVAIALVSLTVRRTRARTIPSPRDNLLPSTSLQQAALPYPPGLLPGARDVATPYGVMRVYEWGPQKGDKVLFIHGDTTPAPMLGPIAHNLVSRGCRVMMFALFNRGMLIIPVFEDLWGRGYSDTPLDVPHDGRLFGQQIFFAAASSPLSWTGAESGGFSVVGFSLGGGIAMAFAADFPYLISTIILLAPAGIIRRLPAEYRSVFFRFYSLIPFFYMRRIVGKILGVKTSHSPTPKQNQIAPEIPPLPQGMEKGLLDVPGIAQWQFDNHKGFVHSFISTIRYGPIQNQHSNWRRVCNVVKGDTTQSPPSSHNSKLFGRKILVIFGKTDSIVRAEEVSADLLKIIDDPNHVDFVVVAGDHGFPVPRCDEVAKHISDFCGFESEA